METPLLTLDGISKSFGANKVLDSIGFEVEKGRCYAIVGENGAGKSTLMKIIGGIYHPDTGRLLFEGKEVHFFSAGEAIASGISIVHQELSLAGNLSVAQNIYCHREPVNAIGFIKWGKLYDSAAKLFSQLGVDIDPREKCENLSVGIQQIVEVAKAISLNSKIIIMDEPTSALSEREIDHLYDIVHDLLKTGVSVIFISHKLNEVFRIADMIYVLRDGCFVAGKRPAETTQEEIINLMVGREMDDYFPPKSTGVGDVLLDIKGLSRSGVFRDVSFDLRRKEILGFAGLVGAGRTEVARGIFGADSIDSGEVWLNGKKLSIKNTRDAIREGICYLTEDRKNLGLFLTMSVRMNIVAASLGQLIDKLGFYAMQKIEKQSHKYVDYMNIRPLSDESKVINLSGGNQQKTLLAKWLCVEPKVLIADEPTRGVDIGAKVKIHQDLRNLAERGVGVIVISSELPEVLGLCDRVVVFNGGRVAAVLENNGLSQEDVMKYAMEWGSK